jgi:O-antigen/teichoic acid export membrane protein
VIPIYLPGARCHIRCEILLTHGGVENQTHYVGSLIMLIPGSPNVGADDSVVHAEIVGVTVDAQAPSVVAEAPPPSNDGPPNDGSPSTAFTPRRVMANSLANLARTLATFVIGFLVPPFLIRWIPKDAYASYILSSRLGAFLVILDLGMQMSLTRLASSALASGDTERACEVVWAAVRLFRKLAGAGIAVLLLLIVFLPNVFDGIPPNLVTSARLCVGLFGLSSLVALVYSPFSGLLVASNETTRVVWPTIALRVLSAVAMLVSAKAGWSIVALGGISAVATISIALLPFVISRRIFPWIRGVIPAKLGEIGGLLIREAGLMSIITLTSFVLDGADVVIVGKFAYGSVPFFQMCVAMVTGLEMLHAGLMQPMLPALSAGRATKTPEAYAKQFRQSARLVAALWACMTVGTFVIAPFLMRRWVGSELGDQATPVLRIMLVGYFLRYGDWAFGVSVVAAGAFKKIVGGPIFGSVCHLTCASVLGWKYGAKGVAIGTVIAAVATMGFVRLVSMPRVRDVLPIKPSVYFSDALFVPVAMGAPVMLMALVLPSHGAQAFSLASRSARSAR